jgi:quercetin dioxygenase-like cupin family protein
MASSPAFSLEEFPAHLGLGATIVREPLFTGGEWFAAYGERHKSDGVEGRLVSMYTFERSWTSWEVHPRGAELVVCTAGTMTVHQEIDGKVHTVTLRAGEAIMNPPGVWHTADVADPCTALFITSGLGTQNRPR